MAPTHACILITLLVTSQVCTGAGAARPLRRFWKVVRARVFTRRAASRSGTRQASAAEGVQEGQPQLSKCLVTFFTEVYSSIQVEHSSISQWSAPLGIRREDIEYRHGVAAVGRVAIAALMHSFLGNNGCGGAECIVQPNSKLTMNSAQYKMVTEYERLPDNEVFILRDFRGTLYSACAVHQPKTAQLENDAIEGAKAVLHNEIQAAAQYGLTTLEDVYEKYRVLTLRDILLPVDDVRIKADKNNAYLNVIFLYPATLSYLSSMLPLNRGGTSSTAQEAEQLERARLSLSYQIISIVGTLGINNVILRRYSTASFFLTASGVVYMAPHPFALSSAALTEGAHYSNFLPCNVGDEDEFHSPPTKFTNAVDLAVVLYNIWCPLTSDLLQGGIDLLIMLPLLTDPDRCYALFPIVIRDLVALLAYNRITVGTVLLSRQYRAILSRLLEMEAEQRDRT